MKLCSTFFSSIGGGGALAFLLFLRWKETATTLIDQKQRRHTDSAAKCTFPKCFFFFGILVQLMRSDSPLV